jgi:hypothetical protein
MSEVVKDLIAADIPPDKYRSLDDLLNIAVQRKLISKADAQSGDYTADAWGAPLLVEVRSNQPVHVQVKSPGRDQQLGTADDLIADIKEPGPTVSIFVPETD